MIEEKDGEGRGRVDLVLKDGEEYVGGCLLRVKVGGVWGVLG